MRRIPVCLQSAAFLLLLSAITQAQPNTGTLHIRVVDADTKQPIAARISLLASDRTYPGDRIGLSQDKWPNLEAHGVFIDAETSFNLPAGKTVIRASAGPQYRVVTREVEVVAREAIRAELQLVRHIDLKKLGWVAGDAHVHMIHGEMQRETSYAEIALTCRANGLDWAYVNQEYGGAGNHSLEGYQDECRKVSNDRFRLFLGGERPKSLLGHNALIGVPNPFIVPDDPPYHRAARAIHNQGGVLFPVHPVRYFPEKKYQGQWLDFPGNNLGREIVFDTFLGPTFDGLSVLSDEPANETAFRLWTNLLDKGFFVPAFADSDACFDRPTLQKNVPGFWATYLAVGPNGSVDNTSLAEAVRRGSTMATTGPLVLWNVSGQSSGSTIPADGRPHQITIEVHHDHHNWTLDEAEVAKVELLRNGKVVRIWEPHATSPTLKHEVSETEPCWYAVRAFGSDARWQVAVASPIYFAQETVRPKQPPLQVHVEGRVYDFWTGEKRQAQIIVSRGDEILEAFTANDHFSIDMPLDASISAEDDHGERITHDLLFGYGPVHQFLWKLDREALGKAETLSQFETLVRRVKLEFPLGYRMSGCYVAKLLERDVSFASLRVTGEPRLADGPISVAAVVLDKLAVQPRTVIHIAVLFHQPRENPAVDPLLVIEGRAYDPRRPTGFNPLKVFGTLEAKWSDAVDAGAGFRCLLGQLEIPDWADPGPANGIEINAFARGQKGKYESHLGLRIPWGKAKNAVVVVSNWPTVPISWHDHNYGIGPLRVCGKLGRLGQPLVDYRTLQMKLVTSEGTLELCPENDCRGCADAADAVYTDHFLDQILNDESHLHPKPDR